MRNNPRRRAWFWVGLSVLFGTTSAAWSADSTAPPISEGTGFTEQGGALLYRAICQGCHMPDGRGASGAGAYPALRENPRVAAASYCVINVLHGRKGMPAFGGVLTDAQVADVVNFVRTHLENHYSDPVSPADVRKLR